MKSWNNIKISKKLLAGFGILSIFIGIMGFVGLHSLTKVNNNAKLVSENILKENYLLEQVRFSISKNQENIYQLINEDNRQKMGSYLSSVDKLVLVTNEMLEIYNEIDLTKEDREKYNQLTATMGEYQKSRNELIENVEKGNYEKAQILSRTIYRENKDLAIEHLNEMVENSMQKATKIHKNNDEIFNSSRSLIFILGVSGVLISVFITVVLSRNIRLRLKAVLTFANQIAEGDLTKTIPSITNDEIGEMSASLNKAIRNMNILVGEIIVDTHEMSATTEELSATMEEISSSMDMVKETTYETTKGIEELSASTEEITVTNEEIEHSAVDLATKAIEGGVKSEEIKKRANTVKSKAVTSANLAISLYNEKQGKIREAIRQAEVVSQVSMLADTIGEIATQTNLLSLNASIEAARAGDAGRGFAVVANEVRSLAEQSNASATNIRQVIIDVQKAFDDMTSISLEIMEFIDTNVKPDYELLIDMGEQYEQDAEFVTNMSNEIASASKLISESISEVSASMLNVSATTEQTSSGSETVLDNITMATDSVREVADAIQSQAELAEKLSKMAQVFKV